MIDLPQTQLALVRRLLAAHAPECEVRAFGSRVTGKAKPYSDLDIVLRGPARLTISRLAAVREAFEESELPIRVEVIDWHARADGFRDRIAAQCEVVQAAAPSYGELAGPAVTVPQPGPNPT